MRETGDEFVGASFQTRYTSMMHKQDISLGIQTFETLITDNRIYVDKTQEIDQCLTSGLQIRSTKSIMALGIAVNCQEKKIADWQCLQLTNDSPTLL